MGGGIQDGLQPVLQLAGDTSENRVRGEMVKQGYQMGGGIQDGLQPVFQLAGDTSENRVRGEMVKQGVYTDG